MKFETQFACIKTCETSACLTAGSAKCKDWPPFCCQ